MAIHSRISQSRVIISRGRMLPMLAMGMTTAGGVRMAPVVIRHFEITFS